MIARLRSTLLAVLPIAFLASGFGESDGQAGAAEAPPDSSNLLASTSGQGTAGNGLSLLRGGSKYGQYLAALIAEGEQDLSSAADFMQNVLSQEPDNESLLVHSFILQATEGRFDKAVALAQRMEGHGIIQPIGQLAQATQAMIDGDAERAETHLAKQPAQGINSVSNPFLLAWVKAAQEDEQAALEQLDTLEQDGGLLPLVELHRLLLNDWFGDTEAAEAAIETLLQGSNELSLRIIRVVGNYLERHGDREKARELYEEQRALDPESLVIADMLQRLDQDETPPALVEAPRQGYAQALFDIASILGQENLVQYAIIHAQFALASEPKLTLTRVLIGEMLQQAGRSRAAIDVYRAMPEDSPFAWSTRLRIAEELYNLDRMDEALAELETLAEMRPERFEPHYRMGNFYRMEERFEDSAEAYNRTIERLGEPQPRHWSLYYFRGIAFERTDRWDQAEADFLKALELQPEQPYVMNYLAYSWVEQKRNYDRAEEMLLQAVEMQPEDGHIVDSLGWVYYRLGRFEEAVEQLEKAVELRPQDPIINDHLGDAYWQTGRKREARIQWSRALSLEPEEDEISEIEYKLEEGLPEDEVREEGQPI
ncbi:tetratricopeptide repeat protein [Fodinicurvata fenggangensis]|uniref:tetratricopeptide repeat protein n=1 Tax=Fodinicurvata fenggangensis TaxID=1121830 RepID=UPI000689E4C3|nr:tetratricopeptide repeat protein [Fodinicurvata fenggangensis]